MSEKNRFSKPVAFNKKNESDKQILRHVSRRNFSGYVKKLILADIASRGKEKPLETIERTKEEVKMEKVVKEVKQPKPKPQVPKERKKSASERIKEMKNRTRPVSPTPGGIFTPTNQRYSRQAD